jgi:hypothetical protein
VRVADARRLLEKAGGIDGIADLAHLPVANWYKNCHIASLAIVRTGAFGPSGVARGWAGGVRSQHSWIVIGEAPQGARRPGPWDASAVVADPTLWSYQGAEPYVHFGKNTLKTHVPHGTGSIWAYGHPDNCAPGAAVELSWKEPPSKAAQVFTECLGPLDRRGWTALAYYPVEGWPAGEIIGAIADTFGECYVPVDILGMTTERNPRGLYW